MRSVFSGLLLLLAMLLLWLYAHDGYVKRINQEQSQLTEQLKQGQYHLNWSLKEPNDLVVGFGFGWQLKETGIEIKDAAAISLAFNQRLLLPTAHQELSFNWQASESNHELPNLLLEFSRVDYGVFYYSPAILVKNGLNHIDLSTLVWSVKPENQKVDKSWSSYPVFNTLVLRFDHKAQNNNSQTATSGVLSAIQIQQSDNLISASVAKQTLAAPLNNQLRQQWQNARFNVAHSPVMQAYFNLPPVWLFSLSLLSLLSAVVCYPRHIKINGAEISVCKKPAIIVIGLVLMVAWSLQFQSVITLFEHQAGLLIALFALPPILLFKKWYKIKNRALFLWIVTFFVALFLLWLAEFKVGFLRDLPLYLLWALCQQIILGPLVGDYLRDKARFSSGFVILLTGALFSVLHLPNQMLMLVTFVAGMLWSYAWLRYQNIYANAVSHALWALLFYQIMPDSWLGTARIGWWF